MANSLWYRGWTKNNNTNGVVVLVAIVLEIQSNTMCLTGWNRKSQTYAIYAISWANTCLQCNRTIVLILHYDRIDRSVSKRKRELALKGPIPCQLKLHYDRSVSVVGQACLGVVGQTPNRCLAIQINAIAVQNVLRVKLGGYV